MVASQTTICCDSEQLSYQRACDIANQALVAGGNDTILILLHRVIETTTAALSRLIVLRRILLRAGRDLRLAGLCGRAEELYKFNRMGGILPRDQQPVQASTR